MTPNHRSRVVRDALVTWGLYDPSPSVEAGQDTGVGTTHWRISPTPFWLSAAEVSFFESLGQHLLAFYRAINTLYLDSVRGAQPAWVAAYLDQGKPESLITYSRMKRFRQALPAVIRPDIIPLDGRMVVTELDSVPGGIGLTAALAHVYAEAEGPSGTTTVVGGLNGLPEGFAAMIRDLQGDRPGCLAIVVSEEAKGYRPEMAWLAAQLRGLGLEAWCLAPRDIRFTEDGLWVAEGDRRIAVLYRFFELFDLRNVPKSELIQYGAKKDTVVVTPPFKPALEEKSAFALLHHPVLTGFWERELGKTSFSLLSDLIPDTWLLDPSPIPPSAVIPGLYINGRPVSDWHEVGRAAQRDRQFVLKPSGFSELAWGSRGVSVGHDLAQKDWAVSLAHALDSFSTTPYVLQAFHKGRPFDLSYYDQARDQVVPMAGRARLSPYYFVTQGQARLAGILATVCPLDKKVIHGMRDAVMAPCAMAISEPA